MKRQEGRKVKRRVNSFMLFFKKNVAHLSCPTDYFGAEHQRSRWILHFVQNDDAGESYFIPRFFFSMTTCASSGSAQMGQMYRCVVSM